MSKEALMMRRISYLPGRPLLRTTERLSPIPASVYLPHHSLVTAATNSFMTALEDEAMREQALKAGCVAFLRKPFQARQLLEAIKKAVP